RQAPQMLLLAFLLPIFCFVFFFFQRSAAHRDLHSFPTRRSSDLPSTPSSTPTRCTRRWCVRRRRSSRGASSTRRSRCTWTPRARSEEHTSELQSRGHLVCRLLLEKKKVISHRQESPQTERT